MHAQSVQLTKLRLQEEEHSQEHRQSEEKRVPRAR